MSQFDTQALKLSDIANEQEWSGGQQLRIAFQNSTLSLTASVFCSFVIVFLLWPVVDSRGLIVWLGGLSSITMLRLLMQQRYTQTTITPELYPYWHKVFVGSAFASGCMWGTLSVFLFPENSVLHQAYLTLVLGGICAGAVAVYAPLKGAFPAFAVPALAPYVVAVWSMGNSEGRLMAALVAAFLLILVRSARQSRQNVTEVLDLQVRNATLTRALHYRATHDSLVDLVNHGEFNRRLTRLTTANRRDSCEYSLIFVDLDLFKAVNDSGGHAAGDLILQGIAKILKANTRASDTVARVGGDEFAILLDGCPHRRGLEIAELIRRDIADMQIQHAGMVHRIKASIGVSYGESGVHSASGMLSAADAACYKAKEEGRNCICMNPAGGHFQTTGRFDLLQSTTNDLNS